MNQRVHHCPSCGAVLSGAPLRCARCPWHLITLETWLALSPFEQGGMLYSQGAWPTSPLAAARNPYEEGTPAWTEFRDGEQRAMLNAQDGEE